MKAALLILVSSLLSFQALADGLKVENGSTEYVTRHVYAQHVKGVNIRLAKRFVREDCNATSLEVRNTLVSGDGEGWYDDYFLAATMWTTEMFCPIDTPVEETVVSEQFFLKSFSNEYVDSEVAITLVLPKGFDLEVTEVPMDTEQQPAPAGNTGLEESTEATAEPAGNA